MAQLRDEGSIQDRPGIMAHLAKLAFIRLVQLSAVNEAWSWFQEMGGDSWLADPPVANAWALVSREKSSMAAKETAEATLRAADDATQVKDALARLATDGTFLERPDIAAHLAKVAFIRLVQLSAFDEAWAVFQERGNETWRQDEPVATALGILPPPRPPFQRA